MPTYYVYIMASKRNGKLYIGVTSRLSRRVGEHKLDAANGFTKKCKVHRLVWYETASAPATAIAREKQIKKWRRAWKVRLIEEMNPTWGDLSAELIP